VPAFEAIRPGRAWTGPYDMCLLDHNAILGPAGGLANFHLCNGFSGHGLQQAPAIGRGLAELIVHGAYRTLDLSELGYERVVANRPMRERNVI
jgi:FAD-dependent oxidoreductase domain-containing protein 1